VYLLFVFKQLKITILTLFYTWQYIFRIKKISKLVTTDIFLVSREIYSQQFDFETLPFAK